MLITLAAAVDGEYCIVLIPSSIHTNSFTKVTIFVAYKYKKQVNENEDLDGLQRTLISGKKILFTKSKYPKTKPRNGY